MDSEYFKVVTHLLARLLEDVRTRDDDVANWPKWVNFGCYFSLCSNS